MSTITPTFSLCYTSRRPVYIKDICEIWLSKAVDPSAVEIVITTDKDDPASTNEAARIARDRPGVASYTQEDLPGTCVKGWNLAASHTTGKILIAISDDFIPPLEWDQRLLKDIGVPGWPDGEYVVHVDDGFIKTLCTIPIITRKRYERFGYLFYPGYQSMFCTPAGTQICMADQTLKPIETISVGDRVVGVRRRIGRHSARGQHPDFLCLSKVIRVFSRRAELVKITLRSGNVLRSTPDHLWAYFNKDITYGEPKEGRVLLKPLDTLSDFLSGNDHELGCLPDEVIKVERETGTSQVFSLKTETENYIADGYLSHNCDTELGERAKLDHVLIEATHLLFEHQHPGNGKRLNDHIDQVHASTARWNAGEALFNLRKSLGFPGPGEEAEKSSVELAEHPRDYAVYTQAIRDDLCLFEVLERLAAQGAKKFFLAVPDHYWSGVETPKVEIEQVTSVGKRLTSLGLQVHVKIFNVNDFSAPGLTRIQVETNVRNASLDWVRAEGKTGHVLIVDGDEVWRRHLLKMVDASLTASPGIGSLMCLMIPVIGLPGYPVDNAQDRVTIYVGQGERFVECRTPTGSRGVINWPGVIHFTACRRSMSEIIQKHRDSGHYDDPRYDFEGWIKRTLPCVRPGFKNAHMYRPSQIWPLVRAWRDDELADIPDILHQFLGKEIDEKKPNPTPREAESYTQGGLPKANPRPILRAPTFYRRI